LWRSKYTPIVKTLYMEAESKTINQFATRVRQMILQYQSVTKQNEDLCRQVAEQQERIAELEAQLQQQRNDYESLKLARMVEITDGDMQSAQKRLAKLIRDVDKCITLVNEKQE
jgi:predicted RNase H-like nuclease (RuvC/YqgF family)